MKCTSCPKTQGLSIVANLISKGKVFEHRFCSWACFMAWFTPKNIRNPILNEILVKRGHVDLSMN